jgi:hypothetical protein
MKSGAKAHKLCAAFFLLLMMITEVAADDKQPTRVVW